MANNKAHIVAGLLFTAAVAGYVTIYLPFYSVDMEELRKRAANRPANPSKSVWGNMDREIKSRKDSS